MTCGFYHLTYDLWPCPAKLSLNLWNFNVRRLEQVRTAQEYKLQFPILLNLSFTKHSINCLSRNTVDLEFALCLGKVVHVINEVIRQNMQRKLSFVFHLIYPLAHVLYLWSILWLFVWLVDLDCFGVFFRRKLNCKSTAVTGNPVIVNHFSLVAISWKRRWLDTDL